MSIENKNGKFLMKTPNITTMSFNLKKIGSKLNSKMPSKHHSKS